MLVKWGYTRDLISEPLNAWNLLDRFGFGVRFWFFF